MSAKLQTSLSGSYSCRQTAAFCDCASSTLAACLCMPGNYSLLHSAYIHPSIHPCMHTHILTCTLPASCAYTRINAQVYLLFPCAYPCAHPVSTFALVEPTSQGPSPFQSVIWQPGIPAFPVAAHRPAHPFCSRQDAEDTTLPRGCARSSWGSTRFGCRILGRGCVPKAITVVNLNEVLPCNCNHEAVLMAMRCVTVASRRHADFQGAAAVWLTWKASDMCGTRP